MLIEETCHATRPLQGTPFRFVVDIELHEHIPEEERRHSGHPRTTTYDHPLFQRAPDSQTALILNL